MSRPPNCHHEDWPCCGCEDIDISAEQDVERERLEAEMYDDDFEDEDDEDFEDFEEDDFEDMLDMEQEERLWPSVIDD